MDNLDEAYERAQNWLDGHIARSTHTSSGFPSLTCIECGCEISRTRLRLDWCVIRCAECQAEHEYRVSRGAE